MVRAPRAPRATVTGIELRISDVATTSNFLRDVVGLSVSPRPNERIAVGSHFVLAPSHYGELPAGAAPVLNVHVDDLPKLAARAEAVPGTAIHWTDDNTTLWIREPGGLRIRVSAQS